MAGIAGIIRLHDRVVISNEKLVFDRIEDSLKYNKSQLSLHYSDKAIYCTSVVPISKKNHDKFIINESLNILCAIDGYVFINDDVKTNVKQRFSITDTITDISLISYLYVLYKIEIVNFLSGCYNLFIYNIESGEVVIINDRLGYLPMYYYKSNDYIIFSSKIECILSSGLFGDIVFDDVSIFERLYFNQMISDNSLIQNIKTFKNACILTICNGSLLFSNYWTIEEHFAQPIVSSKTTSFDLINNALEKAIQRIVTKVGSTAFLSFTGGLDSRLLLAYLQKEQKVMLKYYSFGVEESLDIQIPMMIAKKENLNYIPFLLDENYMHNHFLTNAKQTIELSCGVRNYKRTHYLFATKEIGIISDSIVTGIFGDEVLKVGHPQGNAVISQRTIDLVTSGFDLLKFRSAVKNVLESKLLDKLMDRLETLHYNNEGYKSSSERINAFRFETNLRKYFGAEANSYNDFVYSYSPFIDTDFHKIYAQTCYSGHRQNPHNRYKLAKQSFELYSKLILNNAPSLAAYTSSRGYSILEASSFWGQLAIMFKKVIKRNETYLDTFGTKNADFLFEQALDSDKLVSHCCASLDSFGSYSDNKADILSIKYWMSYILGKYS